MTLAGMMERIGKNDGNIFKGAFVALMLVGGLSWLTIPTADTYRFIPGPVTWEKYCGEQMMWVEEDGAGCFTPTRAQIRAKERQLTCEADGDQWVDGDCVAVTD